MRFLENSKDIVRYLFFLVFAFLIFFSIPKEGKFKYEFNKNEFWKHEDLIAPFSFGVSKTEDEIEQEKKQIKDNFKPYFKKIPQIESETLQQFNDQFNDFVIEGNKNYQPEPEKELKQRTALLLDKIYSSGLLELPDELKTDPGTAYIILLDENQVSEERKVTDCILVSELPVYLDEVIHKDTVLINHLNAPALLAIVKPNYYYDKELSEAKLQSLLSEISLTKGLVEEGDKIISKGVKISSEKFRILESLKNEYQNKVEGNTHFNMAGYFLLIVLLVIGFAVYLNSFFQKIFQSAKRILLILATSLLFIVLSAYITRATDFNLYLIPYCIVPIIILSFFGSRIAFITHLFTILIVSTFSPDSFEFLFIETLAGLAVVVGISKVKYLSQFFLAVLLISFVYYLSYFGLQLIHSNSLKEIEYSTLLWFSGSFLLTLLAYPLIYAYEKIFGLLSDITLIELSDINKKLLRELSMKAPGTFQHSIQVGNLAEIVLNKIGGNALLARVSCLYHDIGKLYAPDLFTENQGGYNPHSEMDELESAKRIIRHIPEGIKMAKAHNLPQEIIDFISMHQGTTRTEYFYRTYKNNHPDEEIDDTMFRYPGPKPKTLETAVVMIVDSVEAAARSLKQPNAENISLLVDKLVEAKMDDNQFLEADISLKNIELTKDILKKNLLTIYHNRIEYPDDKKI